MNKTRELQFFFFGFLACFVLWTIIWKAILLQQSPLILDSVGQEKLNKPAHLTDKDGYIITEERQAILGMGTLPEDLTIAQYIQLKHVGLTTYGLVGGHGGSFEKTTFLGVLKLDEEKKHWDKFIELKGNYSVHDIWHESGPDVENPRINLAIATSAYGGDVYFIDMKQTEAGKNAWKVMRCYYGATDLGNQTEFSRDEQGTWYEYSWVTKENLSSDAAIHIPSVGCNIIPEITLHN